MMYFSFDIETGNGVRAPSLAKALEIARAVPNQGVGRVQYGKAFPIWKPDTGMIDKPLAEHLAREYAEWFVMRANEPGGSFLANMHPFQLWCITNYPQTKGNYALFHEIGERWHKHVVFPG